MARVLQTTPEFLFPELVAGVSATATRPTRQPKLQVGDQAPNSSTEKQSIRSEIPVLGTGHGAIIDVRDAERLSGEVGRIHRPPSLSGFPSAYALYITGSSMEPRYYAGDIVVLNPHRPARPGDFVVVRMRVRPEAPEEVIVKRFAGRRDGWVVLEELNPLAAVQIPESQVEQIHVVLDTRELLGG
jgi:phage repressor protein C with HTH and peptisase S24 domain